MDRFRLFGAFTAKRPRPVVADAQLRLKRVGRAWRTAHRRVRFLEEKRLETRRRRFRVKNKM